MDFEYGVWTDMVRDFVQVKFPQYKGQGYKVISFQFSYLNVADVGSYDIQTKFFDPNYNGWNVYDIMALEDANPDITVIYWTTSLSKNIGTQISTEFNDRMRQFAAEHNKPLFDFADIESHDLNGNLCLYGSFPRICDAYSTEINGGHLGSMSTGAIRLSKAFWVVMAKLSGYD
jgi:hypothetical protein